MSATAVLDVARRELGVKESPANSNRTKYGAAYGMNGVAWCAQFTWWCFQQAGVGSLTPKSAYTPAIWDWYRKKGLTGSAPRVGALALFDFPNDNVNRISHIGLVEAVHPDGSVTCIEGNTSPGTAGSQRDGGGVYRRRRKAGIVGYAYPAYAAAPAPAPAPAPPSAGQTLRRGMKGAEVRRLQEIINARHSPNPRLKVDGDFGPALEKAVKDIQNHFRLTKDGIVGPATRRVIGL